MTGNRMILTGCRERGTRWTVTTLNERSSWIMATVSSPVWATLSHRSVFSSVSISTTVRLAVAIAPNESTGSSWRREKTGTVGIIIALSRREDRCWNGGMRTTVNADLHSITTFFLLFVLISAVNSEIRKRKCVFFSRLQESFTWIPIHKRRPGKWWPRVFSRNPRRPTSVMGMFQRKIHCKMKKSQQFNGSEQRKIQKNYPLC